jgi:hypothetical protein
MIGVFKTKLPQKVVVKYKVLPEIFGTSEDDFEYIPEQIELTEVKLEILNVKSAKFRAIHIIDSLSPTEIMELEDQIMAHRAKIKQEFQAKQLTANLSIGERT